MSKSPSPCAFIEYMDRANAEQAAAHLYRVLVIRGCSVSVNWAKPKTGSSSGPFGTTSSSVSSEYGFLPPPPGLEQMHFTAYALPGMPLPMLHVPITPQAPQLSVPSASEVLQETQGSGQSKRRKVEEENSVVTSRYSSSVVVETPQEQSSLGLDYLNAYDADD
jgi:hypothetical protein